MRKILLCVSILVLLSSCSQRQFYEAGKSWQQYECSKISDYEERSRCLESSHRSYEEYRESVEKSSD